MTPEQIEEMKRGLNKPLSAMERLMLHVECGHEAPDLTDVYEESQALTAEIDRLRAKVEARFELRFRHLTIALGLCADALDEAHSELRDHADTHPSIRQIDEARDAARAALTAYREAGQ